MKIYTNISNIINGTSTNNRCNGISCVSSTDNFGGTNNITWLNGF